MAMPHKWYGQRDSAFGKVVDTRSKRGVLGSNKHRSLSFVPRSSVLAGNTPQ